MTYSQEAAAKEVKRLAGWVAGDKNIAVDVVDRGLSFWKPSDPTTGKVEMRAQAIAKRKYQELFKLARETLTKFESQLARALDEIDALENKIRPLMREHDFSEWFSGETPWDYSPFYPPR